MDAAEFKQQFLPYHRKLYRTAFRLTENPQEAEDMVQEAYLKLWNKRDELAGVLNTEAYCVTLVKNLCYDALRRSRPDEDGHAPEELNLPTDTNIAREVEQRDEVNQVRRLIGRLPEQQKRVILLRDVNDCSFEEIEQATGLNAINIRVLLSRARKKIREQYNAIMTLKIKKHTRVLRLQWIGSIAASLLILLSVGLYLYKPYPAPQDTCATPEEAYVQAQKALIMLSSSLNKGIEKVESVQEATGKIQENVNEQLNRLNNIKQ